MTLLKRNVSNFRTTSTTVDPRLSINFLLNRNYRMEISYILNNNITKIPPRDPRYSINYLLNEDRYFFEFYLYISDIFVYLFI